MSDAYYNILNKDVCQKWKMGPPGTLAKGAYNHALNYDVGSCVYCFISLAFIVDSEAEFFDDDISGLAS